MSSQLNHEPEKLKVIENMLFDRTFRDNEGKIVIAQKPNLPLLLGLTATLFQFLPTSGKLQTGIEFLAFGALFTWSWQELFEGVNYFRRALGGVVLASILALKIYRGGM
jgi:hypothetical protein